METVSHIKSKLQSPLKAEAYTRTLSGSFAVASGTLSGLPTKHGILVGDFVSYDIDLGTPTVIETAIGLGSDLSAYAGGLLGNIGYFKILKTASMYSTIGDMQTAFPVGITIYLGGAYTGEYVDTGEILTAPGTAIHDGDITPGLTPGYWYIIINLGTTSAGFPAMAAFTSETTFSPAFDIYNSAGGIISVSNCPVLTIAANSVTISGSTDGTGILELSVRTDSAISGKIVADHIDAQQFTRAGTPVLPIQVAVPFTGSISGITERWKGKDFNGNSIANPTVKMEPVQLGSDPFGFVSGTNTVIQILSNPVPGFEHQGVAIYQNVGDSKIYMRCFTFDYDIENDFQLYPAIEIVGADSTDLKASFVTTRLASTFGYFNTRIFVFGGNASPGTNAWAGIYSIETDLTITTNSAWGDTGYNVDNDFSGIIKVVDMQALYSTTTRKRVLVLFNSTNIAMFDEGLVRQWNASIDSSFVNVAHDYLGDASNNVVVVTNTTVTDISNGSVGTSYDITTNCHATWDMNYTGSQKGLFKLYKLDRFEGIGLDSILVDGFSDDPHGLPKESVFEPVATNFQNTSGKSQNLVFTTPGDLLIFYKSFGYYVVLEKTTGKLLAVTRDSGDSDTVEKADFFRVVLINGNTILRWEPSGPAWIYEKFLLDGPYYVVSKIDGQNLALALPVNGVVTTDFALEPGRIYYASFAEFIATNRVVGTSPNFAPRKLGVALGTNTFKAEMDIAPKLISRLEIPYAQAPGVLAFAGSDLGNGNVLEGLFSKVVSPHYLERYFRYRREIPRWTYHTVQMNYDGINPSFQVSSPFSATEGGYIIGQDTTGYGGQIPVGGAMIHQVVLMNPGAISGTGLSSALLSVGTEDGALNFESVSGGSRETFGSTGRNIFVTNVMVDSNPSQICIFIRTTGANVADCLGTVKVAILWSYFDHLNS